MSAVVQLGAATWVGLLCGLALALAGQRLWDLVKRAGNDGHAPQPDERDGLDVIRMAQVAHDMRVPLAALETVGEQAARLPRQSRTLLRQAVGRMRAIADELLQQQSANHASSALPCQVLPLVQAMAAEQRLLLGAAPLTVEVAPPAYAAFLPMAPLALQRIVSNLLSNAREASVAPAPLYMGLELVDGCICLTICDRGRGMSTTSRRQLGRRGYTAHKAQGRGLGLATAWELIRAAGGHVEVHSQPGRGTEQLLRFANVPPPGWFLPALRCGPDRPFMLVGAPTHARQAWLHRLSSMGSPVHGEVALPARLSAEEATQLTATWLVLHDDAHLPSALRLSATLAPLAAAHQVVLVSDCAQAPALQEACMQQHIALLHSSCTAFVPLHHAAGIPE